MPLAYMKSVVGLTLAALATVASSLAAPGRMDTSKRASQVSTEEKAILPENRPIERNEVLMDRRFSTEVREKKAALVGERRSTIAVEERRDKKFFRVPERKEPEQIERKDSRWSGKQSRYSTSEDTYNSKVALRFQEKIDDARPFVDAKPVISKRTTFERINRFAFRRNNGDAITVTTAGSEVASRDISEASSTNPDSRPAANDASTSTPAPAPASAPDTRAAP
jgi:hypothetical protein